MPPPNSGINSNKGSNGKLKYKDLCVLQTQQWSFAKYATWWCTCDWQEMGAPKMGRRKTRIHSCLITVVSADMKKVPVYLVQAVLTEWRFARTMLPRSNRSIAIQSMTQHFLRHIRSVQRQDVQCQDLSDISDMMIQTLSISTSVHNAMLLGRWQTLQLRLKLNH